MNEVLKVIKSRRSCKKYKKEQITEEELNQILEAGIYAPSGKNGQAAILVAIQDKEVIKELSNINTKLWGKGPDGFYGAPTVVVVLANPKICHTYKLDGMACVENMLIAAESLGVGAACISRAKEGFESEYGKELKQRLGIDEEYEGIEHVILGYSDDNLIEKPRRENRIYKI